MHNRRSGAEFGMEAIATEGQCQRCIGRHQLQALAAKQLSSEVWHEAWENSVSSAFVRTVCIRPSLIERGAAATGDGASQESKSVTIYGVLALLRKLHGRPLMRNLHLHQKKDRDS